MSGAIELPAGTLGEVVDHLQALHDTIEMITDPEVRREAEEEIERYIEAEVKKVDNISAYIKFCERQAAAAREDMDQLRDRARTFENRRDRIRKYVVLVMQRMGWMKLDGKTATFYLRDSEPSVVITDLALVPAKFKQIEEIPKKREIAQAIKAGEQVPGAELALGGQMLVRR